MSEYMFYEYAIVYIHIKRMYQKYVTKLVKLLTFVMKVYESLMVQTNIYSGVKK